MNQNDLFKDLNTGLPEDIQRLKDAGHLSSAVSLIDQRLQEEGLSKTLRNSLLINREMILRTPLSFTVPFNSAVEKIRELIPFYAESQLREFLVSRTIDWCYIDGNIYILDKYLDTMKRYDSFNELIPGYVKEPLEEKERYKTVTKIKSEGKSATRIKLRHCIKLKDEYFTYGMKLKVHLPIPIPCSHQSEIVIERMYPEGGVVSSENSLQRTISWDVELNQNTVFMVEYSYLSSYEYVDIYKNMDSKEMTKTLRTISNAEFTELLNKAFDDAKVTTENYDFKECLCEEAPHILFTPLIRSLCDELTEGMLTSIDKAKSFYDYITMNMSYGYQPEYFLMGNIPERCAKSMRGDCGVFALLFITLCRCAGIPAEWESGMCVHEDGAHNHDWAKIYLEPYGWVYVDPSYGVGSRNMGFEEGRKYYFGNLDDHRMAANRSFEKDFENGKHFFRIDPYDNQSGEIESDERGYTHNEIEYRVEVLNFTDKTKEKSEQISF